MNKWKLKGNNNNHDDDDEIVYDDDGIMFYLDCFFNALHWWT